jgi:hypothetical protein
MAQLKIKNSKLKTLPPAFPLAAIASGGHPDFHGRS